MSESAQSNVDDLLKQLSDETAAMAGETAQALDQVTKTTAEITGEIQSSASPAAQGSVGAAAGGGGAMDDSSGMPEQTDLEGDIGEAAPAEVPGFLDPVAPVNSELRRLLSIEVPVIVQLGVRRMTVGEVMRFSVGAILEFQKNSDDELELLAANKPIGKGFAVKVGENFGIKLTSIGAVKETIRKLGCSERAMRLGGGF